MAYNIQAATSQTVRTALASNYQPYNPDYIKGLERIPARPVQLKSTELKVPEASQQALADWYASREWHGD